MKAQQTAHQKCLAVLVELKELRALVSALAIEEPRRSRFNARIDELGAIASRVRRTTARPLCRWH